jgi:hypothetical protein
MPVRGATIGMSPACPPPVHCANQTRRRADRLITILVNPGTHDMPNPSITHAAPDTVGAVKT